jgi:hypothetical protein
VYHWERPWAWGSVKDALLNPALSGMRAYQRSSYLYPLAKERVQSWQAELTPGSWEPIVTFDEWQALKAVLTSTRSKTANKQKYIGAGLYQCGVGKLHRLLRSR